MDFQSIVVYLIVFEKRTYEGMFSKNIHNIVFDKPYR